MGEIAVVSSVEFITPVAFVEMDVEVVGERCARFSRYMLEDGEPDEVTL